MKPNLQMRPKLFEPSTVRERVRAAGSLSALKYTRKLMPGSLPLEVIARLQKPPHSAKLPAEVRAETDPAKFATALMVALGVPMGQVRIEGTALRVSTALVPFLAAMVEKGEAADADAAVAVEKMSADVKARTDAQRRQQEKAAVVEEAKKMEVDLSMQTLSKTVANKKNATRGSVQVTPPPASKAAAPPAQTAPASPSRPQTAPAAVASELAGAAAGLARAGSGLLSPFLPSSEAAKPVPATPAASAGGSGGGAAAADGAAAAEVRTLKSKVSGLLEENAGLKGEVARLQLALSKEQRAKEKAVEDEKAQSEAQLQAVQKEVEQLRFALKAVTESESEAPAKGVKEEGSGGGRRRVRGSVLGVEETTGDDGKVKVRVRRRRKKDDDEGGDPLDGAVKEEGVVW